MRGGAAGNKLILEGGTISGETVISARDDRSDVVNPVTVEIKGGTVKARDGVGVNINHRPHTGNFGNTGGDITFDMSGGSIGETASDDTITRVGTTGLAAGIQAVANTQPLRVNMTGSSVYATQRGMSLSHSGTGPIDVDIGSGARIDTSGTGNRGAGVFVSRGGPGSPIQIDSAGTILSAGFDSIFVISTATGDTPITLNHTGSITAANNGIYVRQGNDATSGHGTVSVTSGGDITTTGPTGIFLDLARGDAAADDAVSVSLTGGTIRAASTGVQVSSDS